MASEVAKRLAEWVRLWREARELTQEEFAEAAGLDPKHYQDVETLRQGDFSMSTLAKLAGACGLTPSELVHSAEMNFSMAEAQAKYGDPPARRPKRKKK